MIIADENIDASLIETIRKNGFEVLSIRENFEGLADKEIINLTKSTAGVLITEDKDFGEWVFAHNMRGFTVIFLRYEKKDIPAIVNNLLNILKESQNNPSHSFYTITKNKIRSRLI
jgi:predicted nuclease of predicted toxin-antitoxin system